MKLRIVLILIAVLSACSAQGKHNSIPPEEVKSTKVTTKKSNVEASDSKMPGLDIANIKVKNIDPKKLESVVSEIADSLYPANKKNYLKNTSEQDRISFCVKLNTKISTEFFSKKGIKLSQLSKTQEVELLPITIGETFAKEWWRKKLGKEPSQEWIDCCLFYSINLLVSDMEKNQKKKETQAIPEGMIDPAMKFVLDLSNFSNSQMLLSREAIAKKFNSK